MQLSIDPAELAPVIAATVAATLQQLQQDQAAIGDELALNETKAARLLDIEPHVLRDARLRGEIAASRIVGRRIRYQRDDLLAYLAKCRIDARN